MRTALMLAVAASLLVPAATAQTARSPEQIPGRWLPRHADDLFPLRWLAPADERAALAHLDTIIASLRAMPLLAQPRGFVVLHKKKTGLRWGDGDPVPPLAFGLIGELRFFQEDGQGGPAITDPDRIEASGFYIMANDIGCLFPPSPEFEDDEGPIFLEPAVRGTEGGQPVFHPLESNGVTCVLVGATRPVFVPLPEHRRQRILAPLAPTTRAAVASQRLVIPNPEMFDARRPAHHPQFWTVRFEQAGADWTSRVMARLRRDLDWELLARMTVPEVRRADR